MSERTTVDSPQVQERPLSAASARKRQAIIDAAADMFLAHGYLGVSMDELSARAGIAKQTLYRHFESKEALFVAMVWTLTDAASSTVHEDVPEREPRQTTEEFLLAYARRQLKVVLTPTLMGLRRLAIGEANRFPELAQVLYERGPGRALAALTEVFRVLNERGTLRVPNPEIAAAHFNWLVMGDAINRAMFLGDDALPSEDELNDHAAHGVAVFLAAYG